MAYLYSDMMLCSLFLQHRSFLNMMYPKYFWMDTKSLEMCHEETTNHGLLCAGVQYMRCQGRNFGMHMFFDIIEQRLSYIK